MHSVRLLAFDPHQKCRGNLQMALEGKVVAVVQVGVMVVVMALAVEEVGSCVLSAACSLGLCEDLSRHDEGGTLH